MAIVLVAVPSTRYILHYLLVTQRPRLAKNVGCFQRHLFVCVFVDTITSERVNVGRWTFRGRCNVRKSRLSSNLAVIAPLDAHRQEWSFNHIHQVAPHSQLDGAVTVACNVACCYGVGKSAQLSMYVCQCDFQLGGSGGHGFGLGAFSRNNYRSPTMNHTMQVFVSDA